MAQQPADHQPPILIGTECCASLQHGRNQRQLSRSAMKVTALAPLDQQFGVERTHDAGRQVQKQAQ